MPNVPTITPGPDDAEYTPEGATETIPLITNVHAEKQSGRTKIPPRFPMKKPMQSSRQSVPSVGAKS